MITQDCPLTMLYHYLSIVFLLICVCLGQTAGAIGLTSEPVITTGLSLPIFAAAPTGDFNHLYVAEERANRIKRLDLTTHQLTTVLDLPDVVVGSQSGLNGFAFHPDFANNGKLYINVSGTDENIRIFEFTRSTSNPDIFDPDSQREILSISNPLMDHFGGWIGFGPVDGLLYIATGDGGNVGPQQNKGLPAQDINDLKGKILRLDIDGDDFPGDPLRNYGIPSDNMFAAGGGAPEIFALGLRHPFRDSFDRETGDLYIGDVGSRFWEEINVLPAGTSGGQNFGWRPREGYEDNPDWTDPSPPGAIEPIYAYPHGTSAAVIGGYVYRGTEIPWLQGTYLFGDYVQHTMSTLRYDGAEATNPLDRTAELVSPTGSYGGIASFAEDAAGELYMIDYNRGAIYRIVAAPPAEYGDYNSDGVVDAADYTVWRDSFGQMGPNLVADGDGDNQVDAADYEIWKQFFGQSIFGPTGNGSSQQVPEPAAWLLLAISAVAVSAMRSRTNGVR